MSEGMRPDELAAGGGGSGAIARDPLLRFAELLASIGTLWTFGLMFLIVADVVGRDFFARPITGVAEIAAHSIVGIVFLQIAAAVGSGRMTRADFLIDRWKVSAPGLYRGLETMFCLLGALAMGLIAYASWPSLVQAFAKSEFFGVQGLFTFPTWPFRGLIVLGSGLAAAMYLMLAVRFVRGRA